ncbi:MAG: enoyl-CoA hydratase [Aquabacterium sp.]
MIELDLDAGGAIATLTLNRPPANAWSMDGLRALKAAVMQLNEDRRVRALVITGQGPKFFSAGADLNVMADGDKAVAREVAQCFGEAFATLQEARMVVIAAINGYAMGGGLECALSCDIRIAERHAQMALPEASVGLLPAGCGTQTLTALVGEGWAKRMILTNERVDADTALRIGLVEEVVDSGAALAKAREMAQRVCSLSPEGVAYSKQLIHAARQGVPRHAALALEREKFVDLFSSPNQKEGVNAFLQKRTPQWQT